VLRPALIAMLTCAGCAGPAAQARRDRAEIADELDEMRAELRREKRHNRDLETEMLVLRDQLDTYEVGAGRVGDVPTLPVEVLAPDETAPNGERLVATTEDGTEIVYVGDAASGKSVEAPEDLDLIDADDLEYTPDEDDVEEPPPPRKKTPKKAATKPAPDPDDDRAARAYEAAVAKVKTGKPADAIAALRAFLEAYPRHDLADNAQYWLGEAYYDQKDYGRALAEFRATVTAYPRGNKVADALLKVGFAYQALGEAAKARAALEQVVTLYPGTPPATLAAGRLEALP
jgi:tol-pal system protein YbgF